MTVPPNPAPGEQARRAPGLEHSLGGANADSGWLAALLPYVAVLRIGVIAREERYLEVRRICRAYRERVRRWL